MKKRHLLTPLPKRARDMTAADRRRVLEQLGLGRNLSDASLTQLAEASVAIDVARRRFVYRAGDPADSVFVIALGRIKLCQIEQGTGREAIIDIVSGGSLFGESALYSNARLRENYAIAYEQSRLLQIPAGASVGCQVVASALHFSRLRVNGENAEPGWRTFCLERHSALRETPAEY